MHVKLEAELATFVHKEAAMIFGTGFQANYATLSALTEKGDVDDSDHNLHASPVEGALRSPRAHGSVPSLTDMDHIERCLENCPPDEKTFHSSPRAFSAMEGDIADLPESCVACAKPYGGRVFVDEAHGIGVLGDTGAGAAEHLGVPDAPVDIIMGTFSKSLASVGGFIAAEKAVVDYPKHTARPFVFSASLPAASVAAVAQSLEERCRQEPERRLHLPRIAQLLRDELMARGFAVLPGETAIVPVVIRGRDRSLPFVQNAAGAGQSTLQPRTAPGGGAKPAAHFMHGRTHRTARAQPSRRAAGAGPTS